MPKETKAAAEPTSAERVKASSDRNAKEQAAAMKANRADREAEAAFVGGKQQAALSQARKVKADPDGDIDQRMAALLKDHQEMGARP